MLTKGTRVRLVHTGDPYTRLKPGDEGVITRVVNGWDLDALEYWLQWDDGSTLSIIPASGDDIEEVL